MNKFQEGFNNYSELKNAYNSNMFTGNQLYDPTKKINHTLYDNTFIGSPLVTTKIDKYLLIDSSDRDHKKYPDPDKYKIRLRSSLRDITSIELTKARLPLSSFTINEYNNTLRYQQTLTQVNGGTYSEITIPVGNWTTTEICNHLITSFGNADLSLGNSTYSVTVNDSTQAFIISKTVPNPATSDEYRHFNLIFNDGEELVYNDPDPAGNYDETQPKYPPFSIAQFLGFSRKNFIESVPSSSTDSMDHISDQCYDLNPNKYVVLHIRNIERLSSPTDAVDGAFAVISTGDEFQQHRFIKYDNEEHIKYFNPRLGKLDELDITFTDREGRPFLFNGGNHVLEFKIRTSTAQEVLP